MSSLERTLSIIKPDAVGCNEIGGIISKLEEAGLVIVACKMIHMTQEHAEKFYDVHKNKPFFRELVEFMTSGPIVVMVLEAENAISINRDVMGATNPDNAKPDTIRQEFGKSLCENAIHGSDGPETAKKEIALFFDEAEILKRIR